MKFSTFAGVATFIAGVFAAPHVETREVAQSNSLTKRVDIGSVLSSLQSEVATIVKDVDDVQALLVSAAAGDTAEVEKIASSLLNLNSTLTNVVGVLNGLGLGSVASDAEGLLGGVVDVVGSVVSGVTGLLGGLLGRDVKTARATDVTSAVSNLGDATSLTKLVGTVLSAVGGLLNNITVSINAGKLGSVTDLASTDSSVGTTLKGLVLQVTGLLSVLLGVSL